MSKRLWYLFLVLCFKQAAHGVYSFERKLVQETCEQYLSSTPSSPDKIVSVLQLLQKKPRTMYYSDLIKLTDTLYATDLIFLHNLGTILGSKNNTAPVVFSRCYTPTEQQLYYQAETIIKHSLSTRKVLAQCIVYPRY